MFRSGWRNRQRSSGIIVSALAGLLIVWVGLTTIAAIGQVATPAPAPHYHGKR
jgi:hypothetical protein